MNVVVTGGRGFIGSHLVDKLIDFGHNVKVIDIKLDTSRDNKNAQYYVRDIADKEGIIPLFEGVDYVFHLAAESRIQPCILNPELAIQTNIIGTNNVLEASRLAGVRKVIYSSTSAVYGLKNNPPHTEDMPCDCLNPYSVTKYTGENLCKMYNHLYGLHTVILRYFNVYGERQPTFGAYATVIGIFLDQIKRGKAVTVVGDGNQTRDYVHVSDVVDANILWIENTYLPGEAFNIGTGVNYSVNEVADMMNAVKIYTSLRSGEARHTKANIDRIQKFGWKPKISLPYWLKSKLE